MAHIIAEAGTNHNGDVGLARELIRIAVDSGVDSVKFQLIYPEGLYALQTRAPDGTWQNNPVVEQRRTSMLGDDDWRKLAAYAEDLGLPLTFSVFDTRGVRLVQELGCPYVKIASTDLSNHRLLGAVADTSIPVVLSTGLHGFDEAVTATAVVRERTDTPPAVLHCVSQYPTPSARVNLPYLVALRDYLGVEVGFSDHTENDTAAAMSVALGATWLEKHFTTDRTLPGFDHAYAAEPDVLVDYVAAVRRAEQAMVPQAPKLGAAEQETAARARRGVYFRADLRAGSIVSAADIIVVRPPTDLPPQAADDLVGHRLTTDVEAYDPVSEAAFR